MDTGTNRFFVLTGGPGGGKSTLIDALRAAGYATVAESARAVIQEQVRLGGSALPWADRAAFAMKMLDADVAAHGRALALPGTVFFDRGVPDVAGYLSLCALPVPGVVERAVAKCRYNVAVFAAPPWREIFVNDAERKQDYAEAVRTYDNAIAVYRAYSYDIVELPRAPVADRVRFVLDRT